MKEIKWIDETTYQPGKEKVARLLACNPTTRCDIRIFKRSKDSHWTLSWPRYNIIHRDLETTDVDEAKRLAIDFAVDFMRQLANGLLNEVDEIVGFRKTYTVGFNGNDETQFDVDDYAELVECLVGFFAENGVKNPKIDYIGVSQYEEEDG